MIHGKITITVTVLMTVFLGVCLGMETEGRVEYSKWSNKAQQTLVTELPRNNLLKWSEVLETAIPTADGPTLCLAISVFQRAGQPERIAKVIPRIKKLLNSERTDGAAIYWLCRHGHHVQVRQWLDAFHQDISSCEHNEMKTFFQWFEKKDGAQAVDLWLREKASHERTAGLGKHWLGGFNWLQLYWERLQSDGKLQAHVTQLADTVRKEPASMDAIWEYTAARRVLLRSSSQAEPMGWLADVVRLEHALDNFVLGGMLASEDEHERAILLFDKSLACPIGEYDRKNFNSFSMSSMYVSPDQVETILRQRARSALAGACFHAGMLDRAQKLVEALTGKKDGTMSDLGPFLLAGQVQAASGQRVVEAKIKRAEEANKDSVHYWLNRANYYIGRKEYEQAEQAFLSGMKLPADARYFDVVRDYGWFLFNRERYPEAEKIFRAEIERVGFNDPNGNVDFWLNQLVRLDGKGDVQFPWDDPLVWQWLSEAKKRGFGQSAQWRMEWAARKAGKTPTGWAAFEKRARVLAADPCTPPLRFCLGRILHSHGQAQEGLRMMADAHGHWPVNGYPGVWEVGETLLGAYLVEGDWKKAEKVLATLENTPGFSKLERSLGQIALAAAKAAALDDAMRLWRRKAALDLTELDDLEALAAAGLAERLHDFYTGLAKQAPDNGAIAAALKKLDAD